MMTNAAQAALRRGSSSSQSTLPRCLSSDLWFPLAVIEQYTKNVRFCIICNYVNKITPAIQSRCTKFRFSPLPVAEVAKRLEVVIESEK